MPGQAAGKSRSEVVSAMNSANCTPGKHSGSGGSPVAHPTCTNKELHHSGATTGKTKKIKIQGYGK